MNLNQIKYFTSSFEKKSFSLAAKEYGVTVQAVSKAMSDLEAELGCRLFSRKNRAIDPTVEGAAFYLRASKVREAFDELEGFRASEDGTEVYGPGDGEK